MTWQDGMQSLHLRLQPLSYEVTNFETCILELWQVIGRVWVHVGTMSSI